MTEIQWVFHYILALVRVAAFVGTMPALGQDFVPRMVKVTLAMVFALIVAPTPENPVPESLGWIGISVGVGREFVVGAMLGFSCGLLLESVKVLGAYVGHQMGIAMGSTENAIDSQAVTMLGQVLEVFAVTALFSVNAHHMMLLGLSRSFIDLPVATTWGGWLAERMAANAIGVTELGLLIGGPIIVFLFAITCFNGVLMKASPQFNLFAVGMPLRVAGGLAGLLIWFPQILTTITRLLQTHKFMILDI